MPNDLPFGATPLDPDEANDLIPEHVSTRGELNAWEQLNIATAAEWLRKRPYRDRLLSTEFMRELHRRMFDGTWTWAGQFRQTMKNIGVPPETIGVRTRDLLDDVQFWIDNASFSLDEIASRFHHRLVAIHLFPNGNGRHARLMADALLEQLGLVRFTWGSGSIDALGDVRERYINALRSADGGDYKPLLLFVRS
jgi:Fic-DOC domain mobile mystery protein B